MTLGVASGLVVGKLVGVFGSAALVIRLGLADLPVGANWTQLLGTALLWHRLYHEPFIGLLAFAGDPGLQEEVKLGILCGSGLAAILGALVLLSASRTTR